MRYDKDFFSLVESGIYVGDTKPQGRVTIEADWELNSTVPVWGNSIRGPFRWFQSQNQNDHIEMEIPHISSIDIDRDSSQDVATCNIALYNQYHDDVTSETPELLSQLGRPGYFWPEHGATAESGSRWSQSPSTGAYDKDGVWTPGFDWEAAIVPYALLRTYQGYGPDGKSVQQALDDGDIFITGVWLIEAVTGGTSGTMAIACKDIGKLLLDQIIMPPLVPNALYPLEYMPDGESRFDSYWEPDPTTGVSPASQGRYNLSVYASSGWTNAANAVDRKDNTFAYSPGHTDPLDGVEYIEFITANTNVEIMNQIEMRAWAGGYTCYLSIYNGSGWAAGSAIPGGNPAVPYVAKTTIPLAIPDGNEREINFSIPDANTSVQRFRLTFRNFYYGNLGSPPYRVGMRSVKAYRINTPAPPTAQPTPADPWTYAMCPHPTRGYWIADDNGSVYAFGDAQVETKHNSAPNVFNNATNFSIGMAAHPDGKGYWVLRRGGHVEAHGSASLHTDSVGHTGVENYVLYNAGPGTDPWGAQGIQAFDIAPTYDGNGYYIITGDGRVFAFGNATSTPGFSLTVGLAGSNWNQYRMPTTNVDNFMQQIPLTILVPANNPLGFERAEVYTFATCRRGTSVAGHPTKLGCWVTNGSGEVTALGTTHYGQLYNRVYAPGAGNSFRLNTTEFTHSIRSTTTGNGYWIAFGSGHIAAYGDAVGQGPTDVYAENPNVDLRIPDNEITDFNFFRALIWSIAPDPDGSGFWLLAADGSVGHYNAKFWGQPGYYGMSGIRWFDGNYEDYVDIVKDVLLWAGWLFYNSGQPGNEAPPVYGNLESTGIPSDAKFSADKFDKQTIIDVINEIKQIVGYSFWIDEQGAAIFTSPNWWQAGNLDELGQRIYVDGSGNRVASTDPGAQVFIPEIDETLTLVDYSTTLSGEALRSEIVIGNNQPDYKDPSSTGFIRYYPNTATENIRPGVPALRNITKPAMWVNEAFENTEEMELMAELINLQIWFSQRTGQVSTVGNPLITINDQVKLYERNTSETYIHYVRGISSRMNLDTGEYYMDLTTNWLGDTSGDWVIVADQNATSAYNRIKISNKVDRWQQGLGLGLGDSNASAINTSVLTASGGFEDITVPFDPESTTPLVNQWTYRIDFEKTGGMSNWAFATYLKSGILGSGTVELYNTSNNLVDSFALPESGAWASPADVVINEGYFLITGTPTGTGNAQLIIGIGPLSINEFNTVVIQDSTIIVQVSTSQSITNDGVLNTIPGGLVPVVGQKQEMPSYTASPEYGTVGLGSINANPSDPVDGGPQPTVKKTIEFPQIDLYLKFGTPTKDP